MKRMLLFGCLAGALAVTACERLDLWNNPPADEVGEPLEFTLDEVARLLAAIPIGQDQVAEVRDAVTTSSGNGYDEEYPMRQVFETPGTGVGDTPATRVGAYPTPLRDLLTAEIRKQYGTRALDADAFLYALSSSDVQIYWPFSEEFDRDETPVITFDPGGRETRNIGWIRQDDGSVEEVVVDEKMARERPVWVINRNRDAEYPSLEMRRREDPDWGRGGGLIGPAKAGSAPGTRAGDHDFKTLVLRSFKANRQFDTWFCGIGGLGQVRGHRGLLGLDGRGTASLFAVHHRLPHRDPAETGRRGPGLQCRPRIGMDRTAGQLRLHMIINKMVVCRYNLIRILHASGHDILVFRPCEKSVH